MPPHLCTTRTEPPEGSLTQWCLTKEHFYIQVSAYSIPKIPSLLARRTETDQIHPFDAPSSTTTSPVQQLRPGQLRQA